MKRKIGLLVMAYGTPQDERDIESYYTHIRHGYPPTAEEVQRLVERYRAIGGVSPLRHITEVQAGILLEQVNEALELERKSARDYECSRDDEFDLYIGYKHTAPFIEEAVTQMHEDGIDECVGIIMSPYFSTFSSIAYFERAQRRARRYQMKIHEVEDWSTEPAFISYWVKALRETMTTADDYVIFSAHSLPYHVIDMGDQYPKKVEKAVEQIATALGIKTYALAWQSAGVQGDWLQPDALEVTKQVHKQAHKRIVYAPVGFICDHLEVLYDNDEECQTLCKSLGIEYKRVPMPNGNREFIRALTTKVLDSRKVEMV